MSINHEHQLWAPSMSTKHEHSVSFEWASLINGQLWPYGIHFPNGFFLSGYVVMTEQSLTWRHVMRCDATFGVALMWKYANKNQVINTHTHQKIYVGMPEWKALWKKNALRIIHFQRIFMSLTLLTVYMWKLGILNVVSLCRTMLWSYLMNLLSISFDHSMSGQTNNTCEFGS